MNADDKYVPGAEKNKALVKAFAQSIEDHYLITG